MKPVHLTLAVIALAASTASVAVEATRFEVPTGSVTTRVAVQAETMRAAKADELRTDNAYPRFMPPAASTVSRAEVQRQGIIAMANRNDTNLHVDSNFIGGM